MAQPYVWRETNLFIDKKGTKKELAFASVHSSCLDASL